MSVVAKYEPGRQLRVFDIFRKLGILIFGCFLLKLGGRGFQIGFMVSSGSA